MMIDDERKRASLFGAAPEEPTTLNLDRFSPKPAPKVDAQTIDAVSKDAGFTTKHAKTKKKPDGRRLKKSLRTSQFNVRLKPETAERFWSGAEAQDLEYADDFLSYLLDIYDAGENR